jgi:hypothetical protein
MKRLCLILTFFLFSSSVFAYDYYYNIDYKGMSRGRELADKWASGDHNPSVAKLSNTQLAQMRKILSDYDTKRGETYEIILWTNVATRNGIIIICEFTSNTQFSYWAYSFSL